MKVAVLVDTWFPFVGGGQINAFEISKRLAKKGIQTEIITRNSGQENIKYPKNLTIVKLGAKSAPENNLARYVYLVRSFFYIYKKDYDLIHAHAFLPGITARLLMVAKGIPSIFTVHGTSLGTKLNSFLSRLTENFILTKILYSSQITVAQDFLSIQNINKKIFYIPNGVDNFYFKHQTVVRKNQILSVARLHPQKNLINLIKAFKIILGDYPNYKLIIAGDGPQKKELIDLIKSLNIQNSINILGEVSKKQLRSLYSSSKLFALPSIYEGQPLALLEALATKLPVIATKTGDIPFIVKETINGYLIDKPADPEKIASVIKKALKNRDLFKLGERGHSFVANRFTWDTAAEKTIKVYEKVTKANS